MGQQQDGAERRACIGGGGMTGRGTGIATGGAGGRGPIVGPERKGWTFDGGDAASGGAALGSGGKVGPAILG